MSRNGVFGCRAGEVFADDASAELFEEYAKECANSLLGETGPQQKAYERLEATGLAHCFAAYVDGVLEGFAFYVIGAPPHYGNRKCAAVESLFVKQEARGSALGGRLMEALERDARANGCEAIFYTAPVGSRLARLLFLSTDHYRNTNHVFCRRLT